MSGLLDHSQTWNLWASFARDTVLLQLCLWVKTVFFFLVSSFLEKIKRCLWLSYTVTQLRDKEHYSPCGNLRMSVRDLACQFRGQQGSSHILFSDSVSQRMCPVILVSHEESLEVPYLPEFCASTPSSEENDGRG